MKRTDHELLLARAWAMFTEAERTAIVDYLGGDDPHRLDNAAVRLDKLADDWIEELRAEKKK